jgi:hypothetical protein
MRNLSWTIPLVFGVFFAAAGLAAPGTASSSGSPGKEATDIPASVLPKTVFLTSARALDALRLSNPAHYARAKRILASADIVCRPGKEKLLALSFDAHEIACMRSMIYTSLPPQRQLSFRLDDTRYIAMVFITEPVAKLTPIPGAPAGQR